MRQIEEIEASLQETGKGSFKDIFRNGSGRFANRAFIAIATQMGQQICGANAITFYQTTIFKKFLGMKGSMPVLMSAVLFSWYVSQLDFEWGQVWMIVADIQKGRF